LPAFTNMSRIAFVCNTAYPLYLYRLGVMKRLTANHDVCCVAAADERVPDLRRAGLEFIEVSINRRGLNPFKEACTLLTLYRLYRKEAFTLVFHFSIKPCIYGSIAAWLAGAKSVCVITGLGYTFSVKNWLSSTVRILYRFALRFPRKVLFLNADDRATFVSGKIVSADKACVIPSEGIDTEFYAPVDAPKAAGAPFVFLFAGRFLWDKGLRELTEAFARLKQKHDRVELWLLGMVDKGNPRGIPEDTLRLWHQQGVIRYLGETSDVRPFIAQCDAAIYPSYYQEGVPRFLLEAMSMEKPIITTNSVGCKELVEDGRNGYRVEPRDVDLLAMAMGQMIELSTEQRMAMGKHGRKKAQRDFSEDKVIDTYMRIVHEVLN
jgi:glycosyltransferase involved in cell wall biosynthesis